MPEENLLSHREEEILQLVATGLTNREIAQELTISPNTVKVHMSNIFSKINVSSRTEATLYGIEHGIVDVPGGESSSPQVNQTSWRDWIKKYSLFWAGLAALILLFFVTFGTNVLFPAPTPAPVTPVDAAERWQELAPMPEARSGMAAAAYNSDIFAVAGQGPDGVSGSVFRYDPDSDTWDTLRDKPTPVTDVEAALIGEKLYVPGGLTADGSPTDILEIYDPRNDTWETGAPLPQAVSAYALADFEGRMYLFGGWDGQTALDTVYIYDPTENTWREGTAMTIARSEAAGVVLEDRIVVLGGRNESGALNQSQAYFPSRDINGEDPWESFPDMPDSRYNFGAASMNNSIYVIGGISDLTETNTTEGWVYADNFWESLSLTIDLGDQTPRLIPLNTYIFILKSSENQSQNELWAYKAIYFEIFIPIIP